MSGHLWAPAGFSCLGFSATCKYRVDFGVTRASANPRRSLAFSILSSFDVLWPLTLPIHGLENLTMPHGQRDYRPSGYTALCL